VCSLRYPVCNGHASYCNQWPVQLYDILPYYLINCTILQKMLLDIKCVLFPCTTFTETFLIVRKNERDMIKKYICLYVNYRCSCQILMKLEFCKQIFEKYPNVKVCGNSTNGTRVVPC
jgi:hypothetical protein